MTELLPAVPDPASATIDAMRKACVKVTEWINQCDDISTGTELLDRVLAVETYLTRKKQAAEAQTAARWLEVRIGELLGPGIQGRPPKNYSNDCSLERWERVDFRLLAQHRDVVAQLVPNTRRRILSEIRKLIERSHEERLSSVTPVELRHGDFRETLTDLTNIDAIITDPPYPYEYIGLFNDLSETAASILKPGGLCAAMVGQSYLPEIFNRLGHALTYRWTIAYLTPGGQAVQAWDRNINTFWKPVLLFTNGPTQDADWIGDVANSAVNDNDKTHHHWGQSESGMADLIRRLTKAGELICDPFLGGGTTAMICHELGRPFIGCDVDQDCVNKTTQRLGLQ